MNTVSECHDGASTWSIVLSVIHFSPNTKVKARCYFEKYDSIRQDARRCGHAHAMPSPTYQPYLISMKSQSLSTMSNKRMVRQVKRYCTALM